MFRQNSGRSVSSSVTADRNGRKPNLIQNLRQTFKNRGLNKSSRSLLSTQSMPEGAAADAAIEQQNQGPGFLRKLRRNRSKRSLLNINSSNSNITTTRTEIPITIPKRRPILQNMRSESIDELQRKAFEDEEVDEPKEKSLPKFRSLRRRLSREKFNSEAQQSNKKTYEGQSSSRMACLKETSEIDDSTTKLKQRNHSFDRDELEALFGSEASLFVEDSDTENDQNEDIEGGRGKDDDAADSSLDYSGNHLLETWEPNRHEGKIARNKKSGEEEQSAQRETKKKQKPGDRLLVNWSQ